MFRRIIWEDVLRDLQTAGLFLLGVAIILLLARVLTTPKEEVRRLSELPLNDE
ncbi:MAG: hypothetical protein WCJ96_05080 [Verrucomicrobiota bacterium]|jgi:hypothetical protein